ncbi:nicotinate-nucleotide--dimethylbenzimidazole phosphoribosyltransferase [Thalassotalea marina]|uniref:Nicotinate-nucleotide--dimethylbenzimidazole phosphoribosyltransferase n=1 Tax=Thalassotalea marina TaxID=1673741 RepID=A0A919EH25_9GAMM|nr:nicotinate-nucleotide--dimethylbenzimidazole phosphoribosyltransferase [Thalassotalea marina]GHF78966.1 nicotinate-nucleotide--dimethylbenzimidazole phosphoribosyltransferase [Thalassotalea marina]
MFNLAMFDVSPLGSEFSQQIQQQIDSKTKPLGALGQLEQLARQLANIQAQRTGQWQNIQLAPQVIVFAGDHGIAQQGVSIAPSEVTQQMVLNFIHGGAAINCFCQSNSLPLHIVDAGILLPIASELAVQTDNFTESRLGAGTQDFSQQAAMTLTQVEQGLLAGKAIVQEKIAQGATVMMFGEMGIANTSSATAIASILLKQPVEQLVGKGTGISEQQLALKTQLISQGVERAIAQGATDNALTLLSEVGGFEIVQITGAILACAQAHIPVLVDGFIVSAAALAAYQINPAVKDYLIFAHQSDEHGHQAMLKAFNAQPLLQLDLRLGEGTGAALAMPLLNAAASFYNHMASFESAGVTV